MPSYYLGHAVILPGTCRHITWDMPSYYLGHAVILPGTCRHITWDMPSYYLGHAVILPGTAHHRPQSSSDELQRPLAIDAGVTSKTDHSPNAQSI
ncbi:hypothetical protein BaRGS_00032027 [Batillaria attramentaria]|uniref:Uncharacterized protein n=1 Tax=Batillaria attramentaria TaxID=370345 RepID=A0ABD0JNU0_9CAEN